MVKTMAKYDHYQMHQETSMYKWKLQYAY